MIQKYKTSHNIQDSCKTDLTKSNIDSEMNAAGILINLFMYTLDGIEYLPSVRWIT